MWPKNMLNVQSVVAFPSVTFHTVFRNPIKTKQKRKVTLLIKNKICSFVVMSEKINNTITLCFKIVLSLLRRKALSPVVLAGVAAAAAQAKRAKFLHDVDDSLARSVGSVWRVWRGPAE